MTTRNTAALCERPPKKPIDELQECLLNLQFLVDTFRAVETSRIDHPRSTRDEALTVPIIIMENLIDRAFKAYDDLEQRKEYAQ